MWLDPQGREGGGAHALRSSTAPALPPGFERSPGRPRSLGGLAAAVSVGRPPSRRLSSSRASRSTEEFEAEADAAPELQMMGNLRLDDPRPVWVEEGRAVMAEEVASRLAWADLGGPASHELVTAAHLARLSPQQVGVGGIFNALSRTRYVLREDSNPLPGYPDPYGSGWHLHRFPGDWYGGAEPSPHGLRCEPSGSRDPGR